MRQISSLAELNALVGQEVAVSDWMQISQERVNNFAKATDDYQWIHLDQERCRSESPYQTTIAHGFLTLALIPQFLQNSIRMSGVKLEINYGLNKLRFPAPVLVDSCLRARFKLHSVKDIPDGAQLTWDVTIESDGTVKPVCVTELIMRRYP